ncbi:hypothetical protein T4C_11545 [Trichinella pseudospiralis]|uniref:Uncharacterized protein n=1 Tax=Trichinella pseudospiralis TaxID=6337 RepID=A0A0V0XPL8_TRIPS|nr:hypothetical protein T4E_5745 [Trichinella pseudospiralis]KRX89901.1 hypothetical protein T4E_8930 [Trichinella pseudospiralis]KRZ42166.1 hypothetical protein T4C_11545 [Trichinella pseudospiralis]
MGFRPRLTISNEFTTETVDNHNARVRETGKRYPSKSLQDEYKKDWTKVAHSLDIFLQKSSFISANFPLNFHASTA